MKKLVIFKKAKKEIEFFPTFKTEIENSIFKIPIKFNLVEKRNRYQENGRQVIKKFHVQFFKCLFY